MEPGETETISFSLTLHWIQLGLGLQVSGSSQRQDDSNKPMSLIMAFRIRLFHSQESSQFTGQADPHLMHLSIDSAFPPFSLIFCIILSFIQGLTGPTTSCQSQPEQSILYSRSCSQVGAISPSTAVRSQLVGRCEFLLWYWNYGWLLLGSVDVGTGFQSGTAPRIQYRLG